MNIWVPLKEKEKKKKKKRNIIVRNSEMDRTKFEKRSFLIFFLFSFLSQIHENLTIGNRRDKHEKCSTRRGLHVGTRNTGFHRN